MTLGAKADVSGNDLLQAWSEDPTVEVAVLQLESLGNPFRFARIARTVGRDLPVVLLRTAGLHDALTRDDAALLRQLGIIDVPSIDEAIDVAALLATEPRPAGRRVGIVSRGRGPGLVARDRLADAGLDVTHFRAVAPDRAFVEDVRAMRDTPGIDALCVVPAEGDEVPRSAGPGRAPGGRLRRGRSPGRSARALARSAVHAEWARHAGQLVVPRRRRTAGRSARSSRRARAGRAAGGSTSTRSPPRCTPTASTPPDPTWCAGSKTPAKRRCRSATPSSSITPSATAPSPSGAHEPGGPGRGWEQLLRRHGPAALPLAVLAAGPRPELSVHVTAHPRLGPLLSLVPSDRRSGPVRRLLPLEEHGLERLLDEVVGPPGTRPSESPCATVVVGLAGLVADHPELVEVHLDAVDTSDAPASVTGAHLAIAPAPGGGDDQTRHLRRDVP